MSPARLTFSRRERQVMDVIHRRGKATGAEVLADLPDAPSYSAVRSTLRLLERKGALKHEHDGPRYIYVPTASPARAQRTALGHVVRTFFGGSAERVVNALVDDEELSREELERIAAVIAQARRRPNDRRQ